MPSNESLQYLIKLVKRYLSGKANKAEKALVENRYQQMEIEKNITDQLSKESVAEIENKLLQKINLEIAEIESTATKVISLKTNWYYRVSAAAAALLLVFCGWYYYSQFNTIPKQTLVQNSSKTDILPGKTKATLTLDDGKKIVLDDAQNGILAKQGTTIIDNLGGKLNYKGGASEAIRFNTLSTQKGEQYAITLNDGTEVFLDASSSIRYPVVFNGSEREVTINGRAYFHVASDKTKPFFVVKGDKKVRVYGTQFNVSAYDNESSMKVTLIEGSVKVMNGNTEGMLLPSQQAVMSKNSAAISIVDNVDLEQCVAWKNGVIAIHHAEVNEILLEMERWYDIDIEIVGKLPKRDLYFDVSRKAKLSELLHILEIYHIKYSLDAVKRKLIVNS